MNDIERKMAERAGLTEEDFKPKKQEVTRISREDFDLLDVTYKETVYFIVEADGTITMTQGEE